MAAATEPTVVPLLELRDVDAAYGPFRAIFGMSFTLYPGRVLAMLGSNGAGKTTVARVASGLLAPTAGKVLFEGDDVTGWRPFRYARIGIVHAPEGRSVFASLSVEENLRILLRSEEDRRALAGGVADGTIDVLVSSHDPQSTDTKRLPFGEAEPGATGLELLLPLTLKWAAEEQVELSLALAKLTSEPARILGLDAGHLGIGQAADACLFDPGAHWLVERRALRSQGKNTPFLGYEVPGKVRWTLVAGQIVHEA